MLSAPTDKLYKFWAIFGLALFAFGIKISITAYDEGQQAQLVFLQSFDPAQRAYARYAESVNGVKAKLRDYNSNPSKETWENFQRYLAAHEHEMDKYQIAAEDIDDRNQSDLRLAEHARKMTKIWLILGLGCVSLGSVFSYIGFRNWVKREA